MDKKDLEKTQDYLEFIPRPYQELLLEKVIEKNGIIYLQTGSGKTYIAVMLIKENLEILEKKLENGGKRTVFLAVTVPLIIQQANYIRMHCHLNVGEYYGSKTIDDQVIDLWDKNIWDNEIEANQILVMTPQILVDIIQHAFLDINQINLLIFDECHHAVGNHPYSQLLRLYHNNHSNNKDIRVMGMTASIVQRKCNLSTFKSHFVNLENKFNCDILTILPHGETKISGIVFVKPKIKVVTFCSEYDRNTLIYKTIDRVYENFALLDQKFSNLKNSQNSFEFIENPYRIFKREFADLKNIFIELGLWSFKSSFSRSKKLLKSKIDSLENSFQIQDVAKLLETIELVLDNLVNEIQCKNSIENCYFEYFSNKVKSLIKIFEESKKLPDSEQVSFHCIVFVDRIKTAICLDELFKEISKIDKYKFLQSDFLFGTSQTNKDKSMSIIQQRIILDRFRQNQTNILFATSVVEEGMDVSSCNMIIRFSKSNSFGSFTQSKGRARSKDSIFYMMIDQEELDEFKEEINDYIDIENELENNFKIKEITDYETDSTDDLEKLNQLIPSYKKGNSEITCNTAINLVNRYCVNMKTDLLSYPKFKFIEKTIEDTNLFSCKVWLPANSVYNSEVQSRFFVRKKWAKMDAALKLCIELDKIGELTDNLTIITRELWIKPHFSFEDLKITTIGSSKKKKKYQIKIADELLDNHVSLNKQFYVFSFEIIDVTVQKLQFKPSDKLPINGVKLGYLNSKNINVPIFKLYQSNKEYQVSIKDFSAKNARRLNSIDDYKLLVQINKSLFTNLLKTWSEYDFDCNNSHYGGFIVFLDKNDEIDWDYMRSLHLENQSLLDYYVEKTERQQTEIDLSQLITKLDIDAEVIKLNNLAKNQSRRLFAIKDIIKNMSTVTEFPTNASSNFKDHFSREYGLKTLKDDQPLIEVESYKLNMNFILKKELISDCGMNQKNIKIKKHKNLFIGEHLKVLPFHSRSLLVLSMLPAIFHRINSLLKAEKLRQVFEKNIHKTLKLKLISITKLESNGTWDESIQFKRYTCSNNAIPEKTNSDELIDQVNFRNTIDSKKDDHSHITAVSFIKDEEKNFKYTSLLPNVYHILQCLTTKNANDSFDLERYEVIGDSYLKLIVVMKIYSEFTKTNEGNMAELKSHRVSNKYLFKLAYEKKLQDYINYMNFQPKVNWIGPNFKASVDNENIENKSRHNLFHEMSDKTLADCVEALIGCYLIHGGQIEAKSIIHWLEFKISNKEGPADFLIYDSTLHNPVVSPVRDNIDLSRFEKFSQKFNYKFHNIMHLYEAFTHPSCTQNRSTSSYQRLEFIGDSVLDFLITDYLYHQDKEYTPGELTNLRAALVNNKFFTHLSLKYEFPKYLIYESKAVFDKITEYTKLNSLYEDGIDLDDLDDNSPKFFADIFESFAGAIYLDSDKSLDAVWKVFHPIFDPYLKKFIRSPPQSPISAFYNLKSKSSIQKKFFVENNQTVFSIYVDGDLFEGRASNKKSAEIKACKTAVKHFSKDKNIQFL